MNIKRTSNLLDETICSIVAFKIDVFFVLLKEKLPNNSSSENRFRFRILLSTFRMLFMKIKIWSEKKGSEEDSE